MPLDLSGFVLPSTDLGLEESPTVFPVEARYLAATRTGFLEPDGELQIESVSDTHKCIVRTDTGDIVGVVGSKYRLLENREFFETIEETMRAAIPEDMWEGAQVRDSVTRAGAFSRRDYVLPAYANELRNTVHHTNIGLRIIAWNSYDGGSSAGLVTGLIDFYCTNGMVVGKNIAADRARHSTRMDPRSFVKPLVASIRSTEEMVSEVRRMALRPITTDDAAQLLEKKFSARRAEALMEQFGREVEARGMNAFALLSALTYYASHDSEQFPTQGRGDNSREILHYREDEVRRVVESPEFQRLLVAA